MAHLTSSHKSSEVVEDVPTPSLTNKIILALAVWIPLAATAYAIVLLWNRMVDMTSLMTMLVMFTIGGFGITIGYHRMLTHKSFVAPDWLRGIFLIAGSITLQGPAVNWAATHIQHHAHSDQEDDPHSPLNSLFHAHVGWILDDFQPNLKKYAAPLLKDRLVMFISRTFLLWVALGFLVPTLFCGLMGYLHGGGWDGFWKQAFQGFLWGGLVRVFLNHHVTWSINSICHAFGSRDYETTDVSRNNFLFGLLAFGEGWHNNHHAFPRSAFHGMKWSQPDPSAWIIRFFEKLGVVKSVVRISAERQEKRRIAGKKGIGTTEHDLLPGLELGPEMAKVASRVSSKVSEAAHEAATKASLKANQVASTVASAVPKPASDLS